MNMSPATQVHELHVRELIDPRTTGGRLRAYCPIHGSDHKRSLSIALEGDAVGWGYCHACGAKVRVIELAPSPGFQLRQAPKPKPTVIGYPALDQDGQLVGVHMRKPICNARGESGKRMWWEEHASRKAASMPLYPLLDLIEAKAAAQQAGVRLTVILCEGEGKADAANSAIRRAGKQWMLAVGTMTGAGGTPCDDSLRPLLDCDVWLWPDADLPEKNFPRGKGVAHMERIAARLVALGALVPTWVQWKEAPTKGDAADYFAAGGTVEQLMAMVSKAPTPNEFNEENENSAGEDELNSLSSLNSWPEPMGEAAFIGPIGRFVEKLAPHTEAAREALLVQALIAVGNAMGRHGHFRAEADEHYTNLFAVIVAGTGARKGVSWGHVKRFLQRVDEPWVKEHIVGGLSSGEGLNNAVRDEDPAIPDKLLLAYEPEFASVFKVKGRDGNTLSTILRQAWDGTDLRTLTRQSPLKATGTHISVIGHITAEELKRLMGETDAANGFANRILWACARRARFLPDGGDLDDGALNTEVEDLHRAMTAAKTSGELKRDADAAMLWRRRYRALSTGRAGLLGAVTGRAEAQVMRLALLYALLDCSKVITRRHLEAALSVWDYCLASAAFIFGAALGDPLAEKLHKALCDRGERGMTKTEMFEELERNYSAEQIDAALGMLEGQGLAEKRRVVGSGGRRVYRWYASGDESNESNEERSDTWTL